MKRTDLSYVLPEQAIAQAPAEPRDHSRLLLVGQDDTYEEARFFELDRLLQPGTVLVLNDTRVFPARLRGMRGTLPCELLLTKPVTPHTWEALIYPGRRMRVGQIITISDQSFTIVQKDDERGVIHIETVLDVPGLIAWTATVGEIPTPPYIAQLPLPEQYQTCFARTAGSAAAPTASLHFTPELLQRLEARGIYLAYLTLHVGLGTFAPVFADDLNDHPMHAEWVHISSETVACIERARTDGRPVIAVGTTVTRALEGVAAHQGQLEAFTGNVALYIEPPFPFRVIDGLITNFHLPETTLMALVAAVLETPERSGMTRLKQAYTWALNAGFRFASFGDAMLILR